MLRYYIYISEPKVQMLFGQVPLEYSKKIAKEFKFDLKIFSTSYKSEHNTADSLVARLSVIERYILAHHEIGSVDYPTEWIYGSLDLKSGSLAWEPNMILYSGETDASYVLLGGSSSNIIGATKNNEFGIPYSFS